MNCEEDHDNREEAVKSPEEIKNIKTLRSLLHALDDGDCDIRENAEKGLVEFGDSAVDTLIHFLNDRDSVIRRGALQILGKMRCLKSVKYIINVLKDEDWSVREKAVDALGEIGDLKAIESLIEKLEYKEHIVRFKAARALGEIGDEKTLESLKKALVNESREETIEAIETALVFIDRNIKKPKGEIKTIDVPENSNFDKEEMGRKIKENFNKEIRQIIMEKPGIPQKDFYKKGYNAYIFWWLERAGYIRREKLGSSYKLFLPDDSNKTKDEIKRREILHRSWEERTKIPVEVYPDSKQMIFEYFGKETLKRMFQSEEKLYKEWQEYNEKYGGQHYEKNGCKVIYPEGITEEDYFLGKRVDNKISDNFLFLYGYGLGFKPNEDLKEVICKYWTKECNNELNKFLPKAFPTIFLWDIF